MTTVFPFGAARCIDCKAPVAIVRRTVAYWCAGHGRVCTFESMATHVVEDDGTTHICTLTGEHAFGKMDAQEAPRSSGVSEALSCHGDSGPAPRPAARSRVASEV